MVWMTGATMIGYYTNKESNTLCQESRGIFGGWFSRNNKVIPKEEKKEEQVSLDFNKIAQFPTGSFWDDLAVTAGQKVRGIDDFEKNSLDDDYLHVIYSRCLNRSL